MKLTGALALLGAALLLTSGGNCGICPAINEDLALFLGPSVSDYVDFVSQYRNESATLETAEFLKICVDSKLTEEDKANAKSLVRLEETREYARLDDTARASGTSLGAASLSPESAGGSRPD
ncbi:major allergen I polypeptide chain 1-like [Chionomys nivalis]|uniref:major allergen I polypeptide chain 1-like n=1 Tax=Chionomys nivalis TaxID=269649 RepID=UPI0025976FA8|nr:major allergen I polypeptide chain 1-like [Chionomys nivalis]